MPSHDYSFVNTPLLLLPSAFPFPSFCLVTLDDCLAAKPPSAPAKSPHRSPQQSPLTTVTSLPDFKNKFSEPEAGREFSGALWASSSECSTDRTSEILYMRSVWAEIRQRSMVGCHPLKIQGTGSSLFSLILLQKCLLIMCQLTHITHIHMQAKLWP